MPARRLLILVPAPGFGEAWDWAFGVQKQALERAGFAVEARPWTEPGDTGGFDAVLPLVAWGYHADFNRWLSLLDAAEGGAFRMINPPALLRWNSDKRYLAELADRGVPTIATRVSEALSDADLGAARVAFDCDTLVVKPPVSAAADGTYKLGPADPVPAAVAGRRMLVQPWVPAIVEQGEWSILLFDGKFSHALVKRPKPGDFRVQPHLGGTEEPCDPPPGSIDLATAALTAAPQRASYARVDMVRDNDGALKIMELELIEPSLWVDLAPDRGAAFAAAIARAVEQPLADR